MTEKPHIHRDIISSKHRLLDLKLDELWKYKYLIYMLSKRNLVSSFKQTILGPLWLFINPILTTVVFVVIFGKIARLSTDQTPQILFYLSGVTLWNFVSGSLTETANVFRGNAGLFGKVYFPRLVVPFSIILTHFVRFLIQFLLFLSFWAYYAYQGQVSPNLWILATPLLIVLLGIFSLGIGMVFSALTTKYRDLQNLLKFGVNLFMYATPIIYPLSSLHGIWRQLAAYNPIAGIFECFKYAWLGKGSFSAAQLTISTVVIFMLLAIGSIIFNKVEKSFIDTV